MIITDLIH